MKRTFGKIEAALFGLPYRAIKIFLDDTYAASRRRPEAIISVVEISAYPAQLLNN